MYQLNVNALRSVMFFAVCRHHEFKEIRFRFFVICPNITPAVAYGSDLACSRIVNSGVFNIAVHLQIIIVDTVYNNIVALF